MLIGAAFALCLATVPLAGGQLAALTDVQFRAGWLVATAILLQITIISLLPNGSHGLHAGVHLATYALVGAFAVANRRVPFLWLIVVGGAMNLAAIAANSGVMPADPHALAAAGIPAAADEFANSRAIADAHLQALGDIFWIPASWPLSNVFSIGDILIVAGSFVALHTMCGSHLIPTRRSRSPLRRGAPTSS